MRSRAFYLAALVSLALLTGCETVQRKFTPKRKEPKHVATSIYFQEGEYQKKFSNDYYYKTHYTLWRTWHDELMDNLGSNGKKVDRAAQEAVGHLQQMQQYLKPEPHAQLEVLINDLAEVVKKLDDSGRTSQTGPIRTELERIRRAVGRDFYYDKIKDGLLSDRVDLGETADETDGSAAAVKSPAPAPAAA